MICSKTERNVLSPNPNPFHYRLHLIPDLTNFIFKGTVQIELDVLAPTDTIIMNALDLTFQDVVVHQGEDIVAKIDGPDVRFDAENERAQIHLPSGMVKQGKARLTINYTGILNDKLKGFYRSRYTSKTSDDKCVDRYMGTTQFEPTDARRALPCWDEPARKATFQVSMTIPSHLTALSNTGEISSTTVANNLKCVTFSKTPVMSTYLLAFAVGEFDWIGSVIPKSRGGTTTLRVFTLPGESHRGRYALELAERILPMYETFFGSDYELEKLDQLAIPDFSAGAMENWGLVTYRETALLCDDSSSATAKERVALVVAHELAHQWFGNLVTMDWWKELWLNESFATWVEYLAVDRLYPSWDMWTQFVNDEKGRALELDALVSSHPIEVEIRNAQEVDEIFDAISYSKGGAVLNMIVSFIGVDTLTSALSKYLSHFKFRNATTKDLWSFLEKESGKPVTQIMSTWTHKQGYPVLEVSCADPKALRVSQRRFLSTGQVSPELDQIVWPIPVRVMAGTTIVDTIFSEREGTIEIDTTNAPYVLVNPGQTAVCRVLYSPEMFQSMVKHVSQMKSVDRLGIVRDAEAFAQAGCQRTSDLLMLLGAICPHERDLTVWCTVASAEAAVKKLLSDRPDLRTKYNAWAASLYKPCAAALGWDARPEDDHRTLQMRGLVCRRLVASRDVEALSKGRTLFQQFLRDPSQVAGDIRLAVFMSEVQGGGWEAVRAVYENATDAAEKTRCLVALGCLDDEASLQRALEYALSDKVRSQDICSLLASLCNNRAGLDLVSNYIKVNFQSLFDKFNGGFMLTRVLKCMDEYGSVEKANEIEAWWLTIPESQRQVADRSVKQVVEVIRNRASWKCRSNDDIEKFLNDL